MSRTPHAPAHAAILVRVRAIPPGHVRTYGDVSPGAPRLAGHVLDRHGKWDVPWHRVVRADGSLAMAERQRQLLVAEGVPFRSFGVVDMTKARWLHDPHELEPLPIGSLHQATASGTH